MPSISLTEGRQFLAIQRGSDFSAELTVTVNDLPFDNTNFTYVCKLRDSLQTNISQPMSFLPGGFGSAITLVVTPDADPTKLIIQMSDTDTLTLVSTQGYKEYQWPELDVQCTAVFNGDVTFIPNIPFIVQIIETSSYA